MFDALRKEDSDVLFYNVFGVVEITPENFMIWTTVIYRGAPKSRRVVHNQKLKNANTVITLPFGAWLDNETPHVAFGDLKDGYDHEVVAMNLAVLENAVKEVVLLYKDTFD